MPTPKHIVLFALKCFACYLILLVASQYLGISSGYIQQFRKTSNSLFSNSTRTGQATFLKVDKPNYDTELLIKGIRLHPQKKGKALSYKGLVSMKTTAYLPFLFLISLIFATSIIGLKEKLWALAGGTLLLHIYVMILMYIHVQAVFHKGEEALGKQTDSLFDQIISFFNYIMVKEVRLLMIVPVIIWVIVCFSSYYQTKKTLI